MACPPWPNDDSRAGVVPSNLVVSAAAPVASWPRHPGEPAGTPPQADADRRVGFAMGTRPAHEGLLGPTSRRHRAPLRHGLRAGETRSARREIGWRCMLEVL